MEVVGFGGCVEAAFAHVDLDGFFILHAVDGFGEGFVFVGGEVCGAVSRVVAGEEEGGAWVCFEGEFGVIVVVCLGPVEWGELFVGGDADSGVVGWPAERC